MAVPCRPICAFQLVLARIEVPYGKTHNYTRTQRTKASEGALESSCRVVNGLDAGWVGGVDLVEQWRHHVALFTHSNSFWQELDVPRAAGAVGPG